MQRLHQDPAEEYGCGERKYAEDKSIPGTAEDAGPVIDHGGERGEDVEDGEQLPGHVDRVEERILNRGTDRVKGPEPDDKQADDDAGGDGSLIPAGHIGEEFRQYPVTCHAVDDPGAEHDAGASGGDHR